MNETITTIGGVEVGHWSDEKAATGVTVMTFPEPNIAAAEVRGGAPGTREIALLAEGNRVETVQAIVFAGGSAFGLATADGVVQALAADGRGHPAAGHLVPIVPAAILFDLMRGDGSVRPGPSEGAAAYRARSSAPVVSGAIGAATGASVSVWRGRDAMLPGGLGSGAIAASLGTVAALVAVNAVGDIFTLAGEPLTGGPVEPGPPVVEPVPGENTTLVALATDLRFTRSELGRIIVRAHDALGACIRPSHTRFDGDVVFAVSCGNADGDVESAGEAAFVAVGRAIEDAVRSTAGRRS